MISEFVYTCTNLSCKSLSIQDDGSSVNVHINLQATTQVKIKAFYKGWSCSKCTIMSWMLKRDRATTFKNVLLTQESGARDLLPQIISLLCFLIELQCTYLWKGMFVRGKNQNYKGVNFNNLCVMWHPVYTVVVHSSHKKNKFRKQNESNVASDIICDYLLHWKQKHVHL